MWHLMGYMLNSFSYSISIACVPVSSPIAFTIDKDIYCVDGYIVYLIIKMHSIVFSKCQDIANSCIPILYMELRDYPQYINRGVFIFSKYIFITSRLDFNSNYLYMFSVLGDLKREHTFSFNTIFSRL